MGFENLIPPEFLDKETKLPVEEAYRDLVERFVSKLETRKNYTEFEKLISCLENEGFRFVGCRLNDDNFYQDIAKLEQNKEDPIIQKARDKYGFKNSVDELIFKKLGIDHELVITEGFDEKTKKLNDSTAIFTRVKAGGTGEDISEKLEAAEKTAKEYKEMALKIRDEIKDIQKRAEQKIETEKKYANEKLLKVIFPVIDNFYRAIENSDGENSKKLVEGIEMNLESLIKALKKFGVEEVSTKEGDEFNPEFHEAVLAQPHDTIPKNQIINEVQKGYLLDERLLRAAQVIVSVGKE